MTPKIDISDLAVQLLPPDKRLPKFTIMSQTVLSPADRLNRIFQDYQNGDVLSDWYSPTYTYSAGDRAKDYFGVYESVIDGNMGNNPLGDKGIHWLKILPCYIGVNERAKYSASKIIFELALNRYFGTTFRQYADAAYTPVSDIYITTDVPIYVSFLSYDVESGSGVSYDALASGDSFDIEVFGSATSFQFTIYVPAAFYASLGPTAEQIVRFFADKINISGITYSITTY